MENESMNDLKFAPVTVVMQAGRDFAATLAESQQFKTFEQLALRFRQDEAAQKDMQAYRQKQQSLAMMLRLNVVIPEDKAELERLHDAWLAHATVMEYLEAQSELVAFCQSLGDLLSVEIGLDFSAACSTSCCG
jgi:cell fate (sporulation/competence/biofilm development) regulator YlbF (YheA/YmcA/DUF963 family)